MTDSQSCARELELTIRPAGQKDRDAVWAVLEPVIRAAETYALDPSLTKDEALAYWLGPDRETFVAEAAGDVVGTYYLRANQPGGGSHVANCGFMTAVQSNGRGVARAMCADALARAKASGFHAMQFNFVVSSNDRAIALWRSFGFEIVGRLPQAFRHPRHGFVDVLVMFRAL